MFLICHTEPNSTHIQVMHAFNKPVNISSWAQLGSPYQWKDDRICHSLSKKKKNPQNFLCVTISYVIDSSFNFPVFQFF